MSELRDKVQAVRPDNTGVRMTDLALRGADAQDALDGVLAGFLQARLDTTILADLATESNLALLGVLPPKAEVAEFDNLRAAFESITCGPLAEAAKRVAERVASLNLEFARSAETLKTLATESNLALLEVLPSKAEVEAFDNLRQALESITSSPSAEAAKRIAEQVAWLNQELAPSAEAAKRIAEQVASLNQEFARSAETLQALEEGAARFEEDAARFQVVDEDRFASAPWHGKAFSDATARRALELVNRARIPKADQPGAKAIRQVRRVQSAAVDVSVTWPEGETIRDFLLRSTTALEQLVESDKNQRAHEQRREAKASSWRGRLEHFFEDLIGSWAKRLVLGASGVVLFLLGLLLGWLLW